jgi:hypothetical protein
LCTLLVSSFGLVGASVATVLAVCLLAGILQAAARRTARVPWDRNAAIRAAVTAGILVALGIVLPTAGVGVVVRGIAVAGALGLLAIELRRLLRISE